MEPQRAPQERVMPRGGALKLRRVGWGPDGHSRKGEGSEGCPDRGTTECCWGVKDRTQNPSLMAEKSLLENTA